MFDSTEFSPDVLTPSILVGFKKRDHAEYEYKRTPSIWPDRDALLDYERALKIEYQINQILAGQHASSAGRGRFTASRTPARSHEHSSVIPSTSASIINAASSIADTPDSVRTAESHQESSSVQDAKLIVSFFQPVYEDWKCLHREMANEPVAKNGLERFECGKL
jgi:Fanconi-associated nuclease 1